MKKVLLLIRHGEVPKAYQNRYMGRTNPPLSVEGREMCAYLSKIQCDKLFVSPLLRAIETASFIPQTPIFDSRLEEIHFGDFENMTFEEISQHLTPEEIDIWMHSPEKFTFPNGERCIAFFERVDAFFDNMKDDENETVAVVTHGGVLMRILSRIRNIPMSRMFETLPARGSLTRIELIHGDWQDAE